jgi:hypothetical protein
VIGTTLSHFRILAKIGEGGMGVVYRAEDEKLRRPVALKVLPPDLVGNEERRLRFLREARRGFAPDLVSFHSVPAAFVTTEEPYAREAGCTELPVCLRVPGAGRRRAGAACLARLRGVRGSAEGNRESLLLPSHRLRPAV